MNKTAQDIMSKDLITIEMDRSVVDAYQMMQRNRIRHLPVADSTGELVGILSDRDLQRCIRYSREHRSSQLDIELSLDPKIKVADVMSWPAHKVSGDTEIRDVAQRMLNEKMSSLLVICPKTHRRGIITTDDLIKMLISMLDKDPSRLRTAVDSLIEDYIPALGGN